MIDFSKHFIATTDEVWRLQNGTDPECTHFQEMADHGHYGGREGMTRQGVYVCAPSGKFLASINSNDPDRVLAMMRRGLEAWEMLPEDERRLAADTKIRPEHRWEDSFPQRGLVLTVITRDLPEQCDPSQPCEVKWNQDYAWFSKEEARQWLPKDVRTGSKHQLPEQLVSRLARLHLVDAVKGQTSQFSNRDVAGSEISIEVLARSGDLATIRISGVTRGDSSGRRYGQATHGVVTRLLGQATYDLGREAFTEFEIVALGKRWGSTRYNGRRRDSETGPLGFVFRLSSPDAPPIAPAFVFSYDVDWVKSPKRGG